VDAHIVAHGAWLARIAFFLIALACTEAVHAHGGGLDRNGCHTNRKTGEYHCHRVQTAPHPERQPQRKPPATNFVPAVTPRADHAFRNCSEARAAGAAPVRRGDPGYAPHLDRDNDGVGCE
jgi:hypothetical protein